MRDEFASVITSLARERDDVCLLSGDIGNRMFDRFKEVDAKRFINCGIAEGSMMSVAAGMALSGLRPFVYTITPFVTTRCLEQIKIGACYHNANITIVGTGAGLSYSELGPTHHSFEDIGILRTLPGITIDTPADPKQVRISIIEALTRQGPTYIRLGKKGEPEITTGKGRFDTEIEVGDEICVVAYGPIIGEALQARAMLEGEGINLGVVCMQRVKPLGETQIREIAKLYSIALVLEEHSIIGGLGDALLGEKERMGLDRLRVKKLAIPDRFINQLGSQSYTRDILGLDANGIIKAVKEVHGGKR